LNMAGQPTKDNTELSNPKDVQIACNQGRTRGKGPVETQPTKKRGVSRCWLKDFGCKLVGKKDKGKAQSPRE